MDQLAYIYLRIVKTLQLTFLEKLSIHERFLYMARRRIHLGRSAYFIRTFGCPVKCPWCDSAGTWHPDHTPKNVEKAEVEDLVSSVIASKCEFVVITGGEPTIHDLSPLTSALHQEKIPVHVETCGAFPFRGDFDWVTLSPKWWKLPLEENLSKASEFKIIVEDEDRSKNGRNKSLSLILMPQSGCILNGPLLTIRPIRKEKSMVLSFISNWVKEHGSPFRAGYQLHKLYDVDRLDPNSRELVPLGGDPNNGY